MKKTVLTGLCALLLMLTACQATPQNTRGASFAGKTIYMDELCFYVYYGQYEMEADAGDMMADLFGDRETFWTAPSGDGTYFSRFAKEEAGGELQRVKTLCKEAEKTGVTLSETERAAAETLYNEFMEDPGNVLTLAGDIAPEKVKTIFLEKALADKMQEKLSAEISTEFDENETRRKVVEGASVQARKFPLGKEEDESAAYSAEEMKANAAAALDKVQKMLEDNAEIMSIFEAFMTDETVEVYGVFDKVISYAELESGSDKKLYYKGAWEMKTGEMKRIACTNSKGDEITYIIRMKDDNSAEERAKAEEEVLKKRHEERFEEVYGALKKKYSFTLRKSTLPGITYQGDAFTDYATEEYHITE